MNTRPFLATHRLEYQRVPRLFPVRTYAEQLHPPALLFEKGEFQSVWEHRREWSKAKTVVLPDEPHVGMMTSPGVSDVEQTTVVARRKRPHAEFFDNDFPEMVENASQAMKETRNLQRHEWREISANPVAPPAVATDGLMDYMFNESIELTTRKPSLHSSSAEPQFPSISGTGNPLSVVRIGDESSVVCALTGLLDSVAVYDVRITRESDDGTIHRLFRRGHSLSVASAVMYETAPVTNIVTSDWEVGSSEPCRALIASTKSISFANVATDSGQPTCEWQDHFSFPATLACVLNPLYPAEFAALCREGLFFGTAEEFADVCSNNTEWDGCFHDVQGVGRNSWYNRIFYGTHPRTLLVSNRREVSTFDTREKVDLASRTVLFNVTEDWNLPHYDSFISVFQPMHQRGYSALIATRTCMNYCDLRMPKNPILDWSLSLPLPIEQICIANLDQQQPRSELIALASRRQSYLEVFHAVHEQGQGNSGFIGMQVQQDVNGTSRSWQPPELGRSSVLWSDLPLAHLQQLKGASEISGMALLPVNSDKSVTLLQWSSTDGLIGQLIDVEAREDGECVFERQTAIRGRLFDSSVNITNFIRKLLACNEFKNLPHLQYPVSECLGVNLLMYSRRLYLKDALRLREIILNDEDDDWDPSGKSRFPRPFLGDIPKVVEIRQNSTDAEQTGKAEPILGPAMPKGRAVSTDELVNPSNSSSSSAAGEASHEYQQNYKVQRSLERGNDMQEVDRMTKYEPQRRASTHSVPLHTGKDLSDGCDTGVVQGKAAVQSTKSGSRSSSGVGQRDSAGEPVKACADESSADPDSDVVKTQILRHPRQDEGSQNAEFLGAVVLPTQSSANLVEDLSSSSSAGSSSLSGSHSSSSSGASNVSSSEEEGEMGELIGTIGHGKTLDEIGRAVRTGMAHCATALGPCELQGIVEESDAVWWYDVEWHSACSADHSKLDTAVTTNGALPDWVCTRVYCTERERAGNAMRNSSIDEDSRYGKLLQRMKDVFFPEKEEL